MNFEHVLVFGCFPSAHRSTRSDSNKLGNVFLCYPVASVSVHKCSKSSNNENPGTKFYSGMRNFRAPGGFTNLSSPFSFSYDELMETYLFKVNKNLEPCSGLLSFDFEQVFLH